MRLWVAGQWSWLPSLRNLELPSNQCRSADKKSNQRLKDVREDPVTHFLVFSTCDPSGCWASQLAWIRVSRETSVCPGRGHHSFTVGKKRPRKWRNQICLIRSFISYLQNDDLAYCLVFLHLGELAGPSWCWGTSHLSQSELFFSNFMTWRCSSCQTQEVGSIDILNHKCRYFGYQWFTHHQDLRELL